MAFEDLDPADQVALTDWLQLVRPIQGEVAKVLNHMAAAKTAHTSHVGTILAQLIDADTVPNTSGLAGAVDVSKAQLTEILAILNGMLTTYNTDTNRQLWTKFCGAENLIG